MTKIKAAIALIPTEAGGRKGPTPKDNWRCILKLNDEYMDCLMTLAPGHVIFPGGRGEVEIQFLDPKRAMLFTSGATFEVWEGGVIGTGMVA